MDWIRQERWINYTRAEQVLVRLGELLRYPPRHRMPALLLFGATGMGKTRIIQRFLRENHSHFDEVRGTTRLPVVALQMPSTPHERDFYEELLVTMEAVLPRARPRRKSTLDVYIDPASQCFDFGEDFYWLPGASSRLIYFV